MKAFLAGLAFLPYLRSSPFGSDTQPHFLAGLALFALAHAAQTGRLPFRADLLLLASALGLGAAALGGGATALGLFAMPLAIGLFATLRVAELGLALRGAIAVYWLGAALGALGPELLDLLTANLRLSQGRGLTSFASEPSYLGLAGLALMAGALTLGLPAGWTGAALGLVLASGSLTAIAPALLVLALAGLNRRRLPLILSGGALALAVLALSYGGESRLGRLMTVLIDAPQLLLLDVSFANRVVRGIGPLIEAWHSGLRPHRFPQEGEIRVGLSLLAAGSDLHADRLSSLATVLAYVFGWLSLPLLWLYLRRARAPAFLWIAIATLAFANLSAATPYLWLLLALPLNRSLLPARPAPPEAGPPAAAPEPSGRGPPVPERQKK